MITKRFPFPLESQAHSALVQGAAATRNSLYPAGKTTGYIVGYNEVANTYRVYAAGHMNDGIKGGRYYDGVPAVMSNTCLFSPADPSVPVIIDFSLGTPCIVGSLPKGNKGVATSTAPVFTTISTGSVDTNSAGTDSTMAMTPKGMIPGDAALVSTDGNYVAALRGKISKLYGAERAQIMALGYHELVRVVTENYENFNSFGELSVTNKNGRSNVSFKGGPDQVSQSGGGQKNWTFHIDIGDVGNMFDMKVTTAENKTMAQAKFSSDGHIEFYGSKGVTTIAGGNGLNITGGNHSNKYEGELTVFVARNFYDTCEGSVSRLVSGSIDDSVGVDSILQVNRDRIVGVGGNYKQIITGGSPATAKPTNVAFDQSIVNGSANIHVGSTVSGSVPTALPGYNIFVYNGMALIGENPMKLMPTTQAAVALNTTLPNSIGLGCIPTGPWATPDMQLNPPTDFAMLYTKWAALMAKLITMLDTHTHSTSWGPSGPAMAPSPGSFNMQVSPLITPVKSVRVCIGA